VTLIVLLIIISFCKFENKFLAGFNFFTNAKYVLNMNEEKHPKDMPSLYGIRGAAMLIMIPGHGAFFRLFNVITDNESYHEFSKTGLILFIGAAGIALCDVFFVSSAIVMTRYLMSKLNK
jgi:peptidoglycan/LPS O-acetylase OafA/YrhL